MLEQSGTAAYVRAALQSDLHPQIANVAQQITDLAQQFSDLRPQIVNVAQQIANAAQQFGIAGPKYGSAVGQLRIFRWCC